MTAADDRLHRKLAEALGLAQATRTAADAVRERVEDTKVLKRVAKLEAAEAELQERLNALVADDGDAGLLAVARRSRDAERRRQKAKLGEDGADDLDALALLVGLAAQELAAWRVIEVLAEAAGDEAVLEVAEDAVAAAEQHLGWATKSTRRVAKRAAREK